MSNDIFVLRVGVVFVRESLDSIQHIRTVNKYVHYTSYLLLELLLAMA